MIACNSVLVFVALHRNDNLKLTHCDNPILTHLKFN